MAGSDYKTRTQQFYDEVLNQGHVERLGEFVDPAFLGPAGRMEAISSSITQLRKQFPGVRLEVDNIIVDGNNVVACWRMTGGEFSRMFSFIQRPGNAPSVSEISGVHVIQIENGKVRDIKSYADLSPYMRT